MPDPPPATVLHRAEWAVCAARFALAEGRAADGIALLRRQLPPPGAEWALPHHLHIRALNLIAQLALADHQLVAAKQAWMRRRRSSRGVPTSPPLPSTISPGPPSTARAGRRPAR